MGRPYYYNVGMKVGGYDDNIIPIGIYFACVYNYYIGIFNIENKMVKYLEVVNFNYTTMKGSKRRKIYFEIKKSYKSIFFIALTAYENAKYFVGLLEQDTYIQCRTGLL